MNIENAVAIVKKQGLIPIKAYEANKYFVFFVVNRSGSAIGNNSAFVLEKSTGIGKWVPQSVFPLDDAGKMKEHSFKRE